jgi:sugar/nucleoside kinase (ribokinase family)
MTEFDFVAVGLTLLDTLGRPISRLPDPGTVELIEEIRMTPAGTAAGPAVIAAKLGLRTRLVGAIAEDAMGRVLRDALVADGVDVGALQIVEQSRTSATILAISPDGDRPALHAPGASLALRLDPPFDAVLSTRFLHLGGVGTMPFIDGAPSQKLLEAARERGIVTTCDLVSPMPTTLPALEHVLPLIDYFMPAADEAIALSGRDTAEDAAQFFMDRGVGACIFKQGVSGSLLIQPGDTIRIPAFRVETVDTTGCGDSYCAGFVAGLGRGFELEEACRFAAETAALVSTGLGSDAGVESFEATLEAMKSMEARTHA